MQTQIPKIIHYCWYGKQKKPENILACMKTWDILNDYQKKEWNETNSDFDDIPFLDYAYSHKKWAFISDYMRLKALYEYGGIYLDTDVEILNSFTPLLSHPMFLGFIYNCSIGTAVIGARPKHPLIKELLDMYQLLEFKDETCIGIQIKGKNTVPLINNNDLFTLHILEKYPSFLLNNHYQNLLDFVIYPKEYFETGAAIGKHYSIHRCEGSWLSPPAQDKKASVKGKIKYCLSKVPIIHIPCLIKRYSYYRQLPSLPFYHLYIQQKKGK